MRRTIWLFIILCFPLYMDGQSYQFQIRHISSRDGLPNEYIHSVFQASDKYVWISTNYGTVRYDGYQMHELLTPLNNATSDFHEDAQGKIWLVQFIVAWRIAGMQEVYIYDPEIAKMLTFNEYFGSEIPVQLSTISKITSDNEGNIWINTHEGRLFRYDGSFKEIMTLPAETTQDIQGTRFQIIPVNDQCFIVKQGWNYLWRVDSSGKYEKIVFPAAISSIQQDENGTLWVITDRTSDIYRLTESGFSPVRLEPEEKVNIYQSAVKILAPKRQIWYTDTRHLHVYDFSGKLLSSLDLNDNGANFKSIVDVYFDADGRAWLATDNGIYIVKLSVNRFTKYLDYGKIKDVREILVAENGEVFVAQNKIHNLTKQTQIHPPHPGQFVTIAKQGNTFWGLSYGNGLMKVNAAAKKKQLVQIADSLFTNPLSNPVVRFSKRSGRLWLGGDKALGIIDTATLEFFPYRQLNGFTSLLDNNIKFFYETKEGIWLLTTNGLYLLNEAKGIVAHYADMFPERRILHMHEDSAGIFWLATERGGLLRWDRTTNKVQQFTKKNGLSHDVIYAVYEDDYGYLWLSSQYGLMRFNKDNYDVNIYLPEDGIIHPEFNRLSHAQASDGRLYFGGLGGVISFHPQDFVSEQPDRTPLRIVAFEKWDGRNGKIYDFTEEFIANNEILLQPYEKSFQIGFVLVNFEKPEENQYAYRIEGMDADWQHIHENSLRINGLPYGKYTLHLRGKKLDKQWSAQQLAIPIHIIRPFYLRWWFLLISVAVLIMGIIALFKIRTYRLRLEKKNLEAEIDRRTATIRRQAEELKQLDEQKSRFFLNVAHELRTPLTLIATPISHYLAHAASTDKNTDLLHSTQRHVRHLLRLVESILDLSKLDAQQLHLRETPVDLASYIRRTFAMYESYAELHQIHYELQCKVNKTLKVWVDESKLEKILHNLLFNALKFTPPGGSVTMQVTEHGKHLLFQIIDTGKGIHPEDLPRIFDRYFQSNQANEPLHGGSGIGLSIAQEYAQLMEGTLQAESALGKGSIFTLLLPKKAAPEESLNNSIPGNSPTVSENGRSISANNGKKNAGHRILVAEDNVDMQELLRQILTPHYEVLQVPNGQAALDVLATWQVDGVITDLMMPKMDGFELVAQLKAHETWQYLPVIVLTARANDTDKLAALRIGVDDYLHKPFSAEELLVRIGNLIANRARRRQLASTTDDELDLTADQSWLQEVENCALSLLERLPEFRISDLADCVHISDRHFRRRIQETIGMTANEYIREIRLQRARQLLERHSHKTVLEIANAVGFSSTSYFTKLYAERFGRKPSDYL